MWNKLGKKLDKSIGILRGFKTAKLLSIFSTILLSNIVSLPTWAQSNINSLEEKTIVQEVIYNNEVVGYAKIPDWNQIGFADLTGVMEGGEIGTEFNQYVDYDLSRQWQPGDSITTIIKLGDISEALSSQDFSLVEISSITGLDTASTSLSSFELVKDQTLSELVSAIPSLQYMQVSEVEPIADLLTQELGFDYGGTQIGSLVDGFSPAANLKLGEIDLSGYSLDSIPGLTDTSLDRFARWQNTFISGVPSLANVPLGLMPSPVTNVGMAVMRIDMIYGQLENNRSRTVSGSYEEGFNVPCSADGEFRCPYLELDDLENSGSDIRLPTEGLQWIAGRDPNTANICPEYPWGVVGGHGVLGEVNCGKEPTGRHPFGKVFKVSVWNTDEVTERADTAIFFRICVKTAFVDLGCTPYFIGPVPWFSHGRDDWVLLGIE